MYAALMTMTARPDSIDALFDAVVSITPRTRDHDGCLAIEPFRPLDGSPRVLIFEKWNSRGDAEANLAEDHMAALMPKLGAWLAGPPEIVDVAGVEG